jgi:hypothetical protein
MRTILFPLIIIVIMVFGCNQPEEAEVDIEQINQEYRKLAIQNCSSCHRFPEPELLDVETWRTYVLPRMGYFYGIYHDESERNDLIEDGSGGQAVLAANIFPEQRQIDSITWKKIVQYYLRNAPDKLPEQKRGEMEKLELFEVREPGLVLSPPSSTLVNFTKSGQVLVGDAHTGAVYFLNDNLELENTARVREGAVHVRETETDWWITVMGSFSPTDASSGLIIKLPRDRSSAAEIVVEGLQRPVDALYEDFNQDGLTDIVVSEFGKWTGSLSLYVNQGGDIFERTEIEARCGATKAVSRDVNGDGLPDIVALFGQGVEALEAYINNGDGSFEHRRLLEFESSYGSSYFAFHDLDNDGDEDIIYTAGDNADYLPVLKPYHGIYLYMNDGDFQFEQSHFLPQNGAYKAIPADFDGDGDLDIASISFFPDYRSQPNEGFVYFENQGGAYVGKSFENLRMGRWISMNMADFDQDGDEDLVLGSLAFETVPVQQELESNWINRGIPFLILENQTR